MPPLVRQTPKQVKKALTCKPVAHKRKNGHANKNQCINADLTRQLGSAPLTVKRIKLDEIWPESDDKQIELTHQSRRVEQGTGPRIEAHRLTKGGIETVLIPSRTKKIWTRSERRTIANVQARSRRANRPKRLAIPRKHRAARRARGHL